MPNRDGGRPSGGVYSSSLGIWEDLAGLRNVDMFFCRMSISGTLNSPNQLRS